MIYYIFLLISYIIKKEKKKRERNKISIRDLNNVVTFTSHENRGTWLVTRNRKSPAVSATPSLLHLFFLISTIYYECHLLCRDVNLFLHYDI